MDEEGLELNMAKTYHVYDVPDDRTVHLESLRPELTSRAVTTTNHDHVTCPGCLDWLRRMEHDRKN